MWIFTNKMATYKGTVSYEEASRVLDQVRADFETDFGTLHIIPEDRHDEVNQLMGDHFFPDEPACSAFGVIRSPAYDSRFCSRYAENLSLMMVNKQTDEVMGVEINHVIRRNDVSNVDGFPKEIHDLFTFFLDIQKDFSIFDSLGTDEVLMFSNLAVAKKYRQLGLGGRLTVASMEFARRLGFKGIKAEGDSVYSQKIYDKLDFEALKVIPYDSYIFEGEPLGNRTGVHRNTKIYGKRL